MFEGHGKLRYGHYVVRLGGAGVARYDPHQVALTSFTTTTNEETTMSARSQLLVFRHDTTESEEPVLVAIKAPEEITLDTVEQWLPTLEKYPGSTYTVMLVSFVCDYDIKVDQVILRAESVKTTLISVSVVNDVIY